MENQSPVEHIRSFNRFYTNLISVLDESVLDTGSSLAEARVLFEINKAKGLTARQIMDEVTIDEGYLSRVINKLIRQGLVEKSQSREDRRQYLLSLSAQGNQYFSKLEEIASNATQELIDDLHGAELNKLLSCMHTIEQLLSKRTKNTLQEITIRTSYHRGDIGYITYLHGLLYDFGTPFETYVAQTLADFYRHMDASKERMWIAEHNGEIIGTIALKDNKDGAAQLRYFLVLPEYRGIGLGGKLMQLFMNEIRSLGYKSSFLLTEAQLTVAASIYKKYGYQYMSSSTLDFGLTEMRYELDLSNETTD